MQPRTAKKPVKWGTVLDPDLKDEVALNCEQRGMTVARFTEGALRQALGGTLLDEFSSDTPIVVSQTRDSPRPGELFSIALLSEHWGTSRLRVLPGSQQLFETEGEPISELRSSFISVGSPKLNLVTRWLDHVGFDSRHWAARYRLEHCDCEERAEGMDQGQEASWHLRTRVDEALHRRPYTGESIAEAFWDDWGIIRLQENPRSRDARGRVLVLAGLSYMATSTCVMMATSRRFSAEIRRQLGVSTTEPLPEFEAIVHFIYVQGVPQLVDPLRGSVRRITPEGPVTD